MWWLIEAVVSGSNPTSLTVKKTLRRGRVTVYILINIGPERETSPRGTKKTYSLVSEPYISLESQNLANWVEGGQELIITQQEILAKCFFFFKCLHIHCSLV